MPKELRAGLILMGRGIPPPAN